MQTAYDFGGAGAGRQINVDSGPLRLYTTTGEGLELFLQNTPTQTASLSISLSGGELAPVISTPNSLFLDAGGKGELYFATGLDILSPYTKFSGGTNALIQFYTSNVNNISSIYSNSGDPNTTIGVAPTGSIYLRNDGLTSSEQLYVRNALSWTALGGPSQPCTPAGTGIDNVCLGTSALGNNTTGFQNTAIGKSALSNNTAGFYNVGLGDSALSANQTGNSNVAIGSRALSVYTLSNGTAVGNEALVANTTGYANTAFGAYTLNNVTTGGFNTAFGTAALQGNITGEFNTALGIRAGTSVTGNNNIIIGADADVFSAAGSNQLSIGNIIFGNGINGTVASPNGLIGIGTNNPTARLEIASGVADTSGLKFSSLTAASPTSTGQAIGVDASGNVVTVASPTSPITVQIGTSLFATGLPLPSGVGATNALDSNFFGQEAGELAINATRSNFFGPIAGFQATNANDSNFLGYAAGGSASGATYSNFFGYTAGNGATDAANSNFFGRGAGEGAYNAANSNFIGRFAGLLAQDAAFSNFIGSAAGENSYNASKSNFLGYAAGF